MGKTSNFHAKYESRKIKWAQNIAHMEEMKNCHIFVLVHEGK